MKGTINKNDIIDRVQPVFRDIFSDPELIINKQSSASTISGWDSFTHINLIVALEEYFSVNFTTKELSEMKCVGDLLELLKSKGVS